MNTKYIYTDGKVTIMDEKGNTKSTEYYDNIDRVLVEENVIEAMENETERLKNEWKKYENGKSDKLLWLVPLLGVSIISLIGPLLVISMFTGQGKFSLVNDAFYSAYVLSITGIIFPAGLIFGAMLSTMEYLQYKINIKDESGIVSKLDYLKEQIVIEKEKLKILKDNKNSENENVSARIVKVDDGEELQKLNSELDQYYELGYNLNKYYHYYKNGKLQDNLPDNFDVNLAYNYIKKKKLVRKK